MNILIGVLMNEDGVVRPWHPPQEPSVPTNPFGYEPTDYGKINQGLQDALNMEQQSGLDTLNSEMASRGIYQSGPSGQQAEDFIATMRAKAAATQAELANAEADRRLQAQTASGNLYASLANPLMSMLAKFGPATGGWRKTQAMLARLNQMFNFNLDGSSTPQPYQSEKEKRYWERHPNKPRS